MTTTDDGKDSGVPDAPHEDPRWRDFVEHRLAIEGAVVLDGLADEPEDANHSPVPADALVLWEEIEADYDLGEPWSLDFREGLGARNVIVSRAAWGARPPRSSSGISPIGLALHYEGPRLGWPFAHTRCFTLMRGIQAYHLDRQGWSDIAYNWLVCGHGSVFVGRGSRVRSAAQGSNDGNARYEAICSLIGAGDAFTVENQAGVWVAAEFTGLAGGPWRPHSSFTPTSCPGDPKRDWIARGHPRPSTAPRPPEPPPDPIQQRGGPRVLLVGE